MRVILSITAALFTLAPLTAFACGGTFCSSSGTPRNPGPAPVDQKAERILFEVHDGTIKAHIQVQYAGDADEFAWVIPVPDVPIAVAESDAGLFDALEQATSLQVNLPLPASCPSSAATSSAQDTGGGCTGGPAGTAETPAPIGTSEGVKAQPPVIVFDAGMTSSYDYKVVKAESATELTSWLNENGYNVSNNMHPVMTPYVEQGMSFLALRLREGRAANSIVPIAITWKGNNPMIPLQMTAVAARPWMGILVFIAGDSLYSPANFDSILPDPASLLHDQLGFTNYYDWVSRVSGEADGKLWVQEYLGPTPTTNFTTFDSQAFPRLSRYYTRLSPEHMTRDPQFVASPAQGQFSGLVDLSARVPVICQDQNGVLNPVDSRLPAACAWQYCGTDGTCVVDSQGEAGCLCGPDSVAQTYQGPDGDLRITCVPPTNPFGITAEAGGADTPFDPCEELDCGAGSCHLKSGFPTCDCNVGAAAFVDVDEPECRNLEGEANRFGPGAGLESEGSLDPLTARSDVLPAPTSRLAGLFLPLVFALGALVAIRHRRV